MVDSRAETGGLMGGEMGVGQTTTGHDSRPSEGCKAGVPQGTMQTFSTHPLT